MVGLGVIHHGDCLVKLRELEDNSVDSIVTDPPYGISFMAKKWDYDVPSVDVWRECLRVLKPGGHMLVACGTRTQHRMVVNIEDAGFEIRDVVTWLYGQGFPKSLDVSKAIDKEAGADREVVGKSERTSHMLRPEGAKGDRLSQTYEVGQRVQLPITAPATAAAREWEGWGTALKPSAEFWTLCRKTLSEPTVAKNVLKWGTGALNIDGCRVGNDVVTTRLATREGGGGQAFGQGGVGRSVVGEAHVGRFPANLILDEEAAKALDAQSGDLGKSQGGGMNRSSKARSSYAWDGHEKVKEVGYGDSGGASRFFYIAKSSKKDRGEGNIHPTCKPTTLMAYLCRLITPPGGLVLDPFAGSGSTGVGALREGFQFIGIEREEQYVAIAKERIKNELSF